MLYLWLQGLIDIMVKPRYVTWRFSQQKLWRIVFWNLIPCNLVEVYQYFGGMYCLHLQVWRVRKTSSNTTNIMGRAHLRHPSTNRRKILKCVLKKQAMNREWKVSLASSPKTSRFYHPPSKILITDLPKCFPLVLECSFEFLWFCFEIISENFYCTYFCPWEATLNFTNRRSNVEPCKSTCWNCPLFLKEAGRPAQKFFLECVSDRRTTTNSADCNNKQEQNSRHTEADSLNQK
jgi:hypothetical protein